MNQEPGSKRVPPWNFIVTTLSMLAFALGGTGCGSLSGSGSGSFASVTIKNHTPDEIAAAAVKVFGAEGFRGGVTRSGEMVFDREASRATSYAREGIIAGTYGAQTINRVRAETVRLVDGSYSLQCKAFMLTGGSDPFFQDEVPLLNIRSAPYQMILNKVQKELE